MGKSLEKRALEEADAKAVEVGKNRGRTVVALRLAGASFSEIADSQGLSNASMARRVFEEAVADSLEDTDLKKARHLANLQLDRLLQSVWGKATNSKNPDQNTYIRSALSILDRKAKLNGIDAPQRVEVYTPEQQEREAWVKAMLEKVSPEAMAEEEDIIDAEVIGDGE